MNEEMRALLTLQLVPGLGPLRTRHLIEHLGSAQAVVNSSVAQFLQVPGIGEKISSDVFTSLRTIDVEVEIGLMEKHKVSLLARGQPGYPTCLSEIYDPPTLLYVRGSLMESDSRAVALVGSRKCSDYGKRTGTRLAMELARAGYVVVSGLARGI